MDAIHIADQVLTASTALAGLLLVFLGNILARYETYDTTQQDAVRSALQRRGWFAFGGFSACLLSALSALGSYWIHAAWVIDASVALLVLALFWALFCGFMSVRSID